MHDGNSQMKISYPILSYPTLCAREDKHPKLATTPSHRDKPNRRWLGLQLQLQLSSRRTTTEELAP
jgi:hypothetical protein